MEIQMAPELRIQQALGIQQAWDFNGHGNSAVAWMFSSGHGISAGIEIHQQAWDFSNKGPRPTAVQHQGHAESWFCL